MSGSHSAYEIYSDWIQCMAYMIYNTVQLCHDKLWKFREDMYLAIMKKYNHDEQIRLCEMTAWLTESLEENPHDVLGEVYMKSDMGSSAAGQFFTPFHLSEFVARIALKEDITNYDGHIIELNEPSCGGGGMIIAAAKVLQEAGINYQKKMKVVAQDLDWKGVYMTYVQLSLLGINAICVHGDTLKNPYDLRVTRREDIMLTPAAMGALK